MNTNNKKRYLLALGVGLSCLTNTSQAAFEMVIPSGGRPNIQIEEVTPKVIQNSSNIGDYNSNKDSGPFDKAKRKVVYTLDEGRIKREFKRLSFKGDSSVEASRLKGESFGSKMELANAAGIFTPNGWQFLIDSDLSRKIVSWEKKPSLIAQLNDIAEQTGLYINIDWNKREIKATRYPISYVFILKKGSKLSDSLTSWAKMSGWEFMWNVGDYDYLVHSDTTFEGNFKQALIKVIKAYQKNGALLDVLPEISDYNQTAKISPLKENM